MALTNSVCWCDRFLQSMDTFHDGAFVQQRPALLPGHFDNGKPCGAYTTELFVKPMTSPVILNFASAHSVSTKTALLNEQMNRAVRLSSDREACNRSLDQMKTCLSSMDTLDT